MSVLIFSLCICFYVCASFLFLYVCFFFFKQKTAYEMRISDWSSDVCSSDLRHPDDMTFEHAVLAHQPDRRMLALMDVAELGFFEIAGHIEAVAVDQRHHRLPGIGIDSPTVLTIGHDRSEEHTPQLQSLMRIPYAVFCLQQKKKNSSLTQQ